MTHGRFRGGVLPIIFLAVLVLAVATPAATKEQGLTERLHYDLFFGPLPVGQARISTYELSSPVGELRQYVFEAESFALVDVVYKVRDYVESVVDTGTGRSLWYLKSVLKEGGRSTFQTRFNWKTSTARKFADGTTLFRVYLPGPVLDPLSVLYRVRGLDLRGVGAHRVRVTDGKALRDALFQILKREVVRVPTGEYDTFKVSVDFFDVEAPLHTGGKNTFTVWVAPNQDNLPVKIAAPIDLGPFNGVLNAALVKVEAYPPE